MKQMRGVGSEIERMRGVGSAMERIRGLVVLWSG